MDEKVEIILVANLGLEDAVKALIKEGANVDESNDKGTRAIIAAAERNKLTIVKTLIEAKADPNVTDVYGRSPLFWAKENKNAEMVEAIEKAIAHRP